LQKIGFIGIDFPKEKFDVSCIDCNSLDKVVHANFENTKQGCAMMLKWLKLQTILLEHEFTQILIY
jgi:hypothetical protein